MAQFDRLLAAMVGNKADSLVLEDGDLAKVEVGGQLRALTKSPISNPQILGLLKEIASPEAQKLLEQGKPATIAHVSGDGAFVVRAMLHGQKWHVVAKIDDHAEFQRRTGQVKASDLPIETPSEGVTAVSPTPANGQPVVPASPDGAEAPFRADPDAGTTGGSRSRQRQREWRSLADGPDQSVRGKRRGAPGARQAPAHDGREGRVGPAPSRHRAAHPATSRRDDPPGRLRRPPRFAGVRHGPVDHARAESRASTPSTTTPTSRTRSTGLARFRAQRAPRPQRARSRSFASDPRDRRHRRADGDHRRKSSSSASSPRGSCW